MWPTADQDFKNFKGRWSGAEVELRRPTSDCGFTEFEVIEHGRLALASRGYSSRRRMYQDALTRSAG